MEPVFRSPCVGSVCGAIMDKGNPVRSKSQSDCIRIAYLCIFIFYVLLYLLFTYLLLSFYQEVPEVGDYIQVLPSWLDFDSSILFLAIELSWFMAYWNAEVNL